VIWAGLEIQDDLIGGLFNVPSRHLQAFNAFNHGQFYGPSSVDGNISSPTFG
jgi:hypothetical protein